MFLDIFRRIFLNLCKYIWIRLIYSVMYQRTCLWPSLPLRLASISRNRCPSRLAARPYCSNAASTHSLNLRRIAFMRWVMAPKSIWCIGSRMSIWCTQKCWICQNALKTRWAPANSRNRSYFDALGPGVWTRYGASPQSTTGSPACIPRMCRPFPAAARVISRRRSGLDLDANSAVDKNSLLGAVHRWQVPALSHVNVSHSWGKQQTRDLGLSREWKLNKLLKTSKKH